MVSRAQCSLIDEIIVDNFTGGGGRNGMAELKPCPFCGYKGIEILTDGNEYLYYRYFSQCQRCGAGAKRGHTKEDAVKEWNRRVDNGG